MRHRAGWRSSVSGRSAVIDRDALRPVSAIVERHMTFTTMLIHGAVLVIVLVAVVDRLQRTHTIKRNFPLIGRFRYWFEALGGQLRQYIVTANDEERPFSRDERRWVYASAKKENNCFGFGSDNDFEKERRDRRIFKRLSPRDEAAEQLLTGAGAIHARQRAGSDISL
jgi:hypothetical protein